MLKNNYFFFKFGADFISNKIFKVRNLCIVGKDFFCISKKSSILMWSKTEKKQALIELLKII